MSNQDIREAIHSGAQVYLRVQVTPTITKHIPVKVVEVKRAAVVIRPEGGKERTVPFRDLEIGEPPPAPSPRRTPAVAAEPAARPAETPAQVPAKTPAPAPTKTPAPAPAETPAPAPAKPATVSVGDPAKVLSQLRAWVEMGQELEGALAVQIATLTQERRGLQTESDAIAKRIEEIEIELLSLSAKREVISKLGRDVTR